MSTINSTKEKTIMKKQDAINHFGGIKKLAQALDIYPQAIYKWGDSVPKGAAYQLHVITDGKLNAEEPIEMELGK